ncbi:MAG: hypothetical protein ACRCS9_08700 [Hyphomicrobium sp.]
MKLAERCAAKTAFEEIRGLVVQQPNDGKRRYVERGSDEYILVCRFVFDGLKTAAADRSNASRYAHCLRQAAKKGLKSAELAKHLSENGGVNALFLRRPLEATTVTTKSLSLTKAITVTKGETFTLELRRRKDNFYDVLNFQ